MKKIFVDKEKMLEKKYITILESIIKAYKDFEHEKLKEVKGAEIDKMLSDSQDYLKRLGELRKQIEKRSQEKTIDQISEDIFKLLEAIFGKKSQKMLVNEFEDFVKQGKFTQQHQRILNDILTAKAEFKKGKLDSRKVDQVRKNASILTGELLEYSQRSDLASLEKSRMKIKYMKDGKSAIAELLHTNSASFLFKGGKIFKITNKIEDSTMQEVTKNLEAQKQAKSLNVNPKVFELLKKELGDFEIVL